MVGTQPMQQLQQVLTKLVGVMLGCCTAQKAVQWSLLTKGTKTCDPVAAWAACCME